MLPQSCDTAVALGGVTVDSQTLFAKNSDRPPDECQPLELHERRSHESAAVTRCQLLSIPEVERTHRHIGSRPYWCWGYEHGFNEYQVTIGNEGLSSKFPEWQTPKLIGMDLVRLGLERGSSAAESVEVMTSLISEYGQGKLANSGGKNTYDNGYIVADPHEAYVIETAGHQWAVRRVSTSTGISNVYSVEADWDTISSEAERLAVEEGWWKEAGRFNFAEAYSRGKRTAGSAVGRRRRSCRLLEKHSGEVDAKLMMALLRDHSDGQDPTEPFQTDIRLGTGICVHYPEDGSRGNTAAGLVADLCQDGSRLPVYWCSFYVPCLGLFLPSFLEGELPNILAIGDEHPSDESPWWLFYQLSQAALADLPARTDPIRARWAEIQEELFDSAYEMAEQGRRLLDQGDSEMASSA